jgi:hypothetical protein
VQAAVAWEVAVVAGVVEIALPPDRVIELGGPLSLGIGWS